MTERLRAHPYASYHQGEPRRGSQSYDGGLGTKKTMLVLVIVVGCFAVLWPKLFYPMLVNNAQNQMKPGPVDKTTGCCDVISELDLDTIKIMSELCSTIIDQTGITPPSPKEIVTQCRQAVLETCGIDISAALQDRISLGHSVKQILEEVRSLNGSLCLKYNFGLSPWRLGVPHRVNINLDPISSIRQERPSQLRSEMIHPAFKERGRAIPQPDVSGLPRRTNPPPRIVEGRPGPIPGMRPAMGGPGHVVAPSKQSNYGFMGILMPIYTVGFVVFFTYTIMKLVFKKKAEAHVGAPLYPPCESDDRFRKEVFEANKDYFHRPNRDSSKIVVNAVSALLEEVNQELEARKHKTSETVHEQDEIKANGSLPKEDEQGTVKVMGMETTASCAGGKKWSRPDSPVLPHPPPVVPKEPSPPPQQIFLEGSLPPQSQILVAESATEAQRDSEDDSPVVLAGKMTLSVISLDSETGTEDSVNSGRRAEMSDEERRRSSSNVSEEFEKINAADLEDQINNIIEEAENIALTEENRYSLTDELDKFTEHIPEEIHKAPQINEKDKDNDVLEEIKNQLNLEDDLLLVLKENEPDGKLGIPVSDIIKEFLNNEETALLGENKEVELSDVEKEDMEVLERYKRSLSEEKDDQELKPNEILEKDSEILDTISKEGGTLGSTEKIDLEPLEEQILIAEESTKVDAVFSTKKEGPEAEESTKIHSSDSLEKENLEPLEKQQQNLLGEELAHLDDKLDAPLPDESKTTGDKNDGELSQDTKEETIIVNSEEKLDFEAINKENSILIQEESSQKDFQSLSSEAEKQDLVTEDKVINDEHSSLIQDVNDKESPKDNQQESVGDSENLLSKNDEVQEEKSALIQEVPVETGVEPSEEKDENLSGEVLEKKAIDEEIQKQEKTSEESNSSNKADLLLQGLIVKEDKESNDQNARADVVLSEQLEDKKAFDILSTDIKKDKTDVDKPQESLEIKDKPKEDTQSHAEDQPLIGASSHLDRLVTENLQEEHNEETKGEVDNQNVITEILNREQIESLLMDEEGLIDDADYDDDSEALIDDEVRDINREIYEDHRDSIERRVNGEYVNSSRNGAAGSENAAENEISEDENLENEDDEDEEIEEIIEYVDNSDEEGEEIIEINGNEQVHLNENGVN